MDPEEEEKRIIAVKLYLKLWRHYGVGNVEFGEPVFN